MAPTVTVLQKEHSSYQKYHLAKVAPKINDTPQKWHLTTTLVVFWSTANTLIEPTPTIRHRRLIGISLWSGKISNLKSHDYESASYNKFKSFLLKVTQLSPWQVTSWHFFERCSIFLMQHLLWVSYSFISGGVFVMCHFFQTALKDEIFVGCI